MLKRMTLLAAILIFLLLWGVGGVLGQSTPIPSPTGESEATAEATDSAAVGDVTVVVEAPTPEQFPLFDLSAIIASFVAYLIYLGAQAGAAQAAIAKLDPVLKPIKAQLGLDDKGYEIVVNVARFVAAIVTLFSLGGVTTAKATLVPILAVFPIPDVAIIVGTILLLVAGQDVIFGLIDRLYATQEALDALKPVPLVTSERQSDR